MSEMRLRHRKAANSYTGQLTEHSNVVLAEYKEANDDDFPRTVPLQKKQRLLKTKPGTDHNKKYAEILCDFVQTINQGNENRYLDYREYLEKINNEKQTEQVQKQDLNNVNSITNKNGNEESNFRNQEIRSKEEEKCGKEENYNRISAPIKKVKKDRLMVEEQSKSKTTTNEFSNSNGQNQKNCEPLFNFSGTLQMQSKNIERYERTEKVEKSEKQEKSERKEKSEISLNLTESTVKRQEKFQSNQQKYQESNGIQGLQSQGSSNQNGLSQNQFNKGNSQGIQSSQGIQNLNNIQNFQNLQSLQGNLGIQGLQNPQANQQTQGNPGIQGNQGITNLQGIQGNQGLQGMSQGIPGIQGNPTALQLYQYQQQLQQLQMYQSLYAMPQMAMSGMPAINLMGMNNVNCMANMNGIPGMQSMYQMNPYQFLNYQMYLQQMKPQQFSQQSNGGMPTNVTNLNSSLNGRPVKGENILSSSPPSEKAPFSAVQSSSAKTQVGQGSQSSFGYQPFVQYPEKQNVEKSSVSEAKDAQPIDFKKKSCYHVAISYNIHFGRMKEKGLFTNIENPENLEKLDPTLPARRVRQKRSNDSQDCNRHVYNLVKNYGNNQ